MLQKLRRLFTLQIVERDTGKSFSEALILESVNPQYDEILFIEFLEKCCVQILF